MTGRGPSWSSHPARLASFWCSRPQAAAATGPYLVVSVTGADQGFWPGFLVGEPERLPVPARPAGRAGRARRDGEVHDPVAAQPAEDLHGQVAQQPGQPGQVIAGVEDHQDARIAVFPVPGRDDPGHHLADLPGRDPGRVIGRAEPHRVQRARPTTCGRAPARRPASTASRGSSAAFPFPRA